VRIERRVAAVVELVVVEIVVAETGDEVVWGWRAAR
jgi:hypothetical protein